MLHFRRTLVLTGLLSFVAFEVMAQAAPEPPEPPEPAPESEPESESESGSESESESGSESEAESESESESGSESESESESGSESESESEPVSMPAPTAPVVEAGPTLVPTASLFSRFEARERFDRIGRPDTDAVRYRSRLGLAVRGLDLGGEREVVVRFVPQATGVWEVGGDTLDDPALGLHEGVLEYHDGGHRLDVGRFEMVYGDHLVIGNVDWDPTGRAFDGVRVHVAPAETSYYVDGFFTVLAEGSVLDPGGASLGDVANAIAAYDADGTVPTAPAAQQSPFGVGDTYFVGVYTGFGKAFAEKLDWDLYLLGQLSPVTTVAGTEVDASVRGTLGTRVKNTVDAFDYRLEAGLQFGEEPNDVSAFAYQGDLELGVTAGSIRLALEAFYASGNDPGTAGENEGWNQLYPTAHKWLGTMDIIGGRTNVGGGVVHLSHALTADLKLALDAHMFARPEAAMVGGGSGYTATEVDVGAVYTIGAGLRLRGGYGLFLPDQDVFGTDGPIHFVETELRYDLK